MSSQDKYIAATVLPIPLEMSGNYDQRDDTGYDLVNAEEICDTIDTIIKRHEADYTRLYVELDELFKNKDGDPQWQHTARWVSTVGNYYTSKNITIQDKI